MKVLHLGDTHFGSSPQRDDVAFRCFEAALAVAITQEVDLVVHAGDVFDHAILNAGDHNPIPRLTKILNNFNNTTDSDIPFIIIRGTPTHDVRGSLDYLNPFAIVVERVLPISILHRTKSGEEIELLCIPEISKAEIGNTSDIKLEYNKLVRNHLEELSSMGNPEALRILLAHICITDAEGSTGFKPGMAIGAKEMLSLSGADVAMLGDIHKAQEFCCGGRVRYSGSICHLNFGEIEPEKGCWLWEFEGRELKGVEWIKLPSRRLITLNVGESLSKEDTDGAEVKIRFRGKFVDNEGMLEKLKQTAHSVIFERIPELPSVRLRSEEIGKAQTITEELHEWGKINEVKITPEILRKADSITQEAL